MGVFVDDLKINKAKKAVDDLFIKMTKLDYGSYLSFRGQEFNGMITALFYLGILEFWEIIFLQNCHSALLDLKIEEIQE